VATTGEGVADVWEAVLRHQAFAAGGLLERRRRARLAEELREIIVNRLELRARQLCTGDRWDELTAQVLDRDLDPWAAADAMLAPVLSVETSSQ
jgi:LAO/AO transport system kinase